jgi:glycosyltransferase involved in cell wall biosynthesis
VRGPSRRGFQMRTNTVDAGQVSVVIPAYNAAQYLAATLQSVSDQSSPPGEVIVVDDGSTDATAEIANSFGARVLSLTNAGPSAARNAGTQAASGEFIAFLDADDVWLPDKLAVQLEALRSHRGPAFSFTDYRMFDEQGLRRRKSELRGTPAFRRIAGNMRRARIVLTARGRRPILYDSYIPPSSVLVRKVDVLAAGGFDETLRTTEDYEFFLRLFRIVPAVAVMKPLLLYRQHAGQATAKATVMKVGFFEVAKRVAAAPDRYPSGDARYIARTEYLRHYRVGMQQSRLGDFDDAVESLRRSLAARPTPGAALALAGAQVCRSDAGRGAFALLRILWKRRPGRR